MAEEPKAPCDCRWSVKDIIALVSALAAAASLVVSSLNNRGIETMNQRPHAATPEQVEQAVEKKAPTADAVADKVAAKLPKE